MTLKEHAMRKGTDLIEKTKNDVSDKMFDKIFTHISASFKQHFGVKEIYNITGPEGSVVIDFLKEFDKKHYLNYLEFDRDGKEVRRVKDYEGVIIIDPQTFVIIQTGTYLIDSYSKNSFMTVKETGNPLTSIKMFFFGKRSYIIHESIQDYINAKFVDESKTIIYKISCRAEDAQNNISFRCTESAIPARSFDTLFFSDNAIEDIKDHLAQFKKSENVFKSRNLLYKTGILLYGTPGTGKSSLASAIARHLNCSLVTIDMSSFHLLNIDEVTASINADDDQYVILLEEIDIIMGSRDEENATAADKQIINKLLQFLDSAQSPTNVVFIATTNHLDRLDPAIIRAGRFNLQKHIGELNTKTAVEMVSSFGIDEENAKSIVGDIVNNTENTTINQSMLQSKIVEYIGNNTDSIIDVDDNGEE